MTSRIQQQKQLHVDRINQLIEQRKILQKERNDFLDKLKETIDKISDLRRDIQQKDTAIDAASIQIDINIECLNNLIQ
jgi:chromosome segregation ATPase